LAGKTEIFGGKTHEGIHLWDKNLPVKGTKNQEPANAYVFSTENTWKTPSSYASDTSHQSTSNTSKFTAQQTSKASQNTTKRRKIPRKTSSRWGIKRTKRSGIQTYSQTPPKHTSLTVMNHEYMYVMACDALFYVFLWYMIRFMIFVCDIWSVFVIYHKKHPELYAHWKKVWTPPPSFFVIYDPVARAFCLETWFIAQITSHTHHKIIKYIIKTP